MTAMKRLRNAILKRSRGEFEKNGVVLAILDHIKIKTELGDELISRLTV